MRGERRRAAGKSWRNKGRGEEKVEKCRERKGKKKIRQ